MAKPNLRTQVPGAKPPPENPVDLAAMYALSPADLAEQVRDLSADNLAALKELAPTGDESQAVRDIVQAEINTRASQPPSDDLSDLSDRELEDLGHRIAAEKARRVAAQPPPSYEPNHGSAHPYGHIPASKVDTTKITKPVLSRDGWVMPASPLVV